MTVKEPTPWATYAVLGAAIAGAVYLDKLWGINIYGWLEWIVQTIKPGWWGATLGIVSMIGLYGVLVLLARYLRKYKCYRTRFRNHTKTGSAFAHTLMIIGVYITLGLCFSIFVLLREIFSS